MHEIRLDPLTGRRVIIATGGGEGSSGAGMGTISDGHPVLDPDAPDPAPEADRDLFWSGAARGTHELIENAGPEPGASLADLDPEQIAATLERWRERMRARAGAACLHLAVDERAPEPGGDPGRPRSRTGLLAFDFVPADIARERERFGAYAARTQGADLLADLVQQEVRRRERVVAIDSEAVLLCAYAARGPYQMILAPRSARPRFEDPGATGAGLLRDGLNRLNRVLGAPPGFSLWVRTAPRGAESFGWRIDILPRLAPLGAIELGAGIAVNPVAPEAAAAALRDASG